MSSAPPVFSIDFETFYSKKLNYSVTEQGTYGYCNDDRFDPYMISVSNGAETWAGQPRDFNWSILEGAVLLSHNSHFDSTVYEAMVRKGLAPQIKYAAWHCTANMSAFLANRRSLADACAYLLNVELSKATRNYADGKHWADIVADGKGEEMLQYARGDAFYCWKLFNDFGRLWPEHERRLSKLTIDQGKRGVYIDRPKLDSYIATAQMMLIKAESSLPWIAEGRPPTSPKAIAEECRKVGIPCPPVKSHEGGEEAFAEWEAAYIGRHAWIANVSAWRSVNKLLESLQTIKTRLMPDGCFEFSTLYFGAHTGRWSGAGGFNMQNIKKEPLYADAQGFLIADETRLKQIDRELNATNTLPSFVSSAIDVRSLFIPRPGKKMILADLSQIEARVLAWVAGDTKMLSLMAAGQSPYEAHARATMGWTGGDLKETAKTNAAAKELYALAKARVLGLGFGCGWKKFITVAVAMAGLDITKDDPEFLPVLNDLGEQCLDKEGNPILVSGYGSYSKKVVEQYRADNPLVRALWRTLDDGFKSSIGADFSMELPSGRELRFPQVRRDARTVKNEETGVNERRWVTTALMSKSGRIQRLPLYGGLLTENLVQATARDVFAEHLLGLQNHPGLNVLFTVHDEAVIEADPDISEHDIKSIMSKTPKWLPGAPIAADVKEVAHYLK